MPVERDDYEIRTRITVDPNIRGLGAVSRQMGGLDSLASSIGGTLSSSLTRGLAALGGGAVLGAATRGLIGMHTEIQNAEMGLASLVSTLTGANIGDSLKIARGHIAGLREDAAKGAGELSDYAQSFQQILAPARQAGASMEDIRKLNNLALQAGYAQRGDEGLKLASLDVVQALTAGVSDRTTPILMPLLSKLGISSAQFNSMDKASRFDVLERAFEQGAKGAEIMGKSWDAQMATLRDNTKDLIRTVTQPLFDRWSEQLMSVNDWMSKNRDVLREMAEDLGPKLVSIYDGLGERAGTIAGMGAAGAVLPTAGRIGGGALGAVGVGGLSAAGMAVIGSGLAALGVGIMSVKGALEESPELATELASGLGYLGKSFSYLVDGFGAFFQPGSPLNNLGRKFLIDAANMAKGAGLLIGVVGLLTKHWGESARALYTAVGGVSRLMKGDAWGARYELEKGEFMFDVANKRLAKGMADLWNDLWKKPATDLLGAGPPVPGADASGQPAAQNNTYFNGPVTVKIETKQLDDPNRVAGAFEELVAKLRSQPIQAKTQRLLPR